MKVISGGQTGVDRAALDAAIELGIDHGGYCPRNRRSEGGPIPDRYKLDELATFSYLDRTKQNIIESDGTLLLNEGKLTGGSLKTKEICISMQKPLWVIQLDDNPRDIDSQIRNFVTFVTFPPATVILNVAGPRESKAPGIQRRATYFCTKIFKAWKEALG